MAVLCTTCFLSRSFENNWNIYKLLAHQKISKEKVRAGCRAHTWLCLWPPPASPPQPGSGNWDPPSCLGLSCGLRRQARPLLDQ